MKFKDSDIVVFCFVFGLSSIGSPSFYSTDKSLTDDA